MKDAFFIVFVNRRTNEIAGAGIYSEPSPTCLAELRADISLQREGLTFEEARDEIRAALRSALNQSTFQRHVGAPAPVSPFPKARR